MAPNIYDKMIILTFTVFFFFASVCLSARNRTVYFVSKNFYNVLHWKPVKPVTPGEEVRYTVLHWK